ncbi:hypothetical protein ACIP1U_27345 [Cupriavidus sp. NPDC089707]|uniref:hypothetical protein n=1 Tax=Cupriavidus sp. NPDC089707 TaxID=3363963 RepID=UPI003807685C
MAAASVPTPIYALYREQWGFFVILLTVIFGVYALSLLAALLTTDALFYLDRRPVILAAMALQAVAILLFLVANSVATLMLARII